MPVPCAVCHEVPASQTYKACKFTDGVTKLVCATCARRIHRHYLKTMVEAVIDRVEAQMIARRNQRPSSFPTGLNIFSNTYQGHAPHTR